ncbi:MAG: hypothetical protein MUP31_07185 [Xanthomonadales bacterium]|nr:hypothetical protein [Xanthomonadales bacterium]
MTRSSTPDKLTEATFHPTAFDGWRSLSISLYMTRGGSSNLARDAELKP